MKRTICAWCKRPFDASRVTARYCSSTCRARNSENARRNRTQPLGAGTQRRQSTALSASLNRALKKTTKTPADGAVIALARLYAKTLDANPDQRAVLGPQYLAVLVQLGMTPNARGSAPTRGGVDGGSTARSALDELRRRREQRAAQRPPEAT